MKIPSYDECRIGNIKEKNPLEKFVYYYAPVGGEGIFARHLSDLLEWVASNKPLHHDNQKPD